MMKKFIMEIVQILWQHGFMKINHSQKMENINDVFMKFEWAQDKSNENVRGERSSGFGSSNIPKRLTPKKAVLLIIDDSRECKYRT